MESANLYALCVFQSALLRGSDREARIQRPRSNRKSGLQPVCVNNNQLAAWSHVRLRALQIEKLCVADKVAPTTPHIETVIL